MDDTGLHYMTYDAEAIMGKMLEAYMEAGGDALMPGDEKEMLLRAVLQVIVQAFAGIDNALRMDTLRYAVRDYLDVYGEKRGCARIAARAATAVIRLTMAATGTARTLAAGAAFTQDGTTVYKTVEDIALGGYSQTIDAAVECAQTGSVGNGLLATAELQAVTPIDGLVSAVCVTGASGGQDKESDESYRERIRTWGLQAVTTGPSERYEAEARAVSGQVVDAKAVNLTGGQVGVYIIPESETGLAALLDDIRAALNDRTARPLTDQVTVAAATKMTYTLNAEYSYDGTTATQSAITQAATEYQAWQERTVGRAFNPDMLAALMYQAGATRVVWGEGSEFGSGGDVEYTEIDPDEYCKGTVTLSVISE